TFAQVQALGLDKRAGTDWVGGWNAFLDESKSGALDGDAFTPVDLSLSLDAGTNDRTFTFVDGDGNYLGSFGDTIDSASKTLVSGTSGSDTITVSGDTISNTTGLTINGAAADGSAKKIDIAAVIDGGDGDDVIRGGDLGNDLLGGAVSDTLVG